MGSPRQYQDWDEYNRDQWDIKTNGINRFKSKTHIEDVRRSANGKTVKHSETISSKRSAQIASFREAILPRRQSSRDFASAVLKSWSWPAIRGALPRRRGRRKDVEGHGCLVGQSAYLMVPLASQASDSVVHVSKCQPLTFKVQRFEWIWCVCVFHVEQWEKGFLISAYGQTPHPIILVAIYRSVCQVKCRVTLVVVTCFHHLEALVAGKIRRHRTSPDLLSPSSFEQSAGEDNVSSISTHNISKRSSDWFGKPWV